MTGAKASPQRRADARKLVVSLLPDEAPTAARELARDGWLARWDGSETEPLRQVARGWLAARGPAPHWLVERLTRVLIRLRQSNSGPDDPSILDARLSHRVMWLTFGDDQVDSDESRGGALLWSWRSADAAQITEVASLSEMTEMALRLPIEADPTRQTRDEFLSRAAAHFDARARGLRAAGIGVHRVAPELVQHARWFLATRFGGRSLTALARAAGRERQTVSEAVANFARLVDLPVAKAATRRRK